MNVNARLIQAILIAGCLGAVPSLAADKIDYLKQVKPLLTEKCYSCHSALKQEAELRLETRALMLVGGDSGAIIAPKNSAGSVIIERITDKGDDRMPPPTAGPRLTAKQVSIIRDWINQGASAPDEATPASPRDHWAFQLPKRADVPKLKDAAWSGNPIDAFIADLHQRRKLVAVPIASRPLLLRRVYLDLIGLPPTRAQLNAFLSDDSEQAYQNVVHELLDSPQHGERWGRHWMDIWRYTDWFGLGKQLRNSQKHIWHWRDWIIESLNQDKGYDRMIVEMLAADEIAPTDTKTLRATGFLARHYYLFNRTTWLDDTLEHTSKAFLGLTLNCTKCHSHKYDPISHVEYYQMRAIFEPYQVRLDSLPGELDLERDGLPRVFDAHPEVATYLHLRGDAKNPDKSTKIEPGVPNVLGNGPLKIVPITLPVIAYQPALRPFVLEDHLRLAKKEIDAATAAVESARSQLAAAQRAELAEVDRKAKVEPKQDASTNNTAQFLTDDFDKARPKLWTTGPGKWKYESGQLIQSQTGGARAWLRSLVDHPGDFEAVLKFKTTGGDKWRSVGLAFDVTENREKLVYLSAVSPGSKLQVSYKTGPQHTYPPTGAQARTVKLNEPYELSIRVRGSLINVGLNGKHAIAYQLPVQREAGKIEIVAFDATVEFDSFSIRPLATTNKLVSTSNKPSGKQPQTVAVTKLALQLAELALASKQLYPDGLRAAHAADVARSKSPAPDNLTDLVHKAARAAREHELAIANESLLRAQNKLQTADAKTKAAADKAVMSAKAAVEKARKAVDKPGEKYTSLRASLKALEGPAESAASRQKPYPKMSTGRRTALANWIANRKNPLTARVAVNHIWLRHFGQPLVESVTDFGLRAKQPVQHKLLDWLAVEFMDHNWSMKHLHQLIVTSRTWRLSTTTLGAVPSTVAADPENDFYWRRKPVRMQSQVIRDSLLQLAGVLDSQTGGPPINANNSPNIYRRSLYFGHSRDERNKFLAMFDDADILRCYRRTESVVPQQALALANSKLSLTMARKIAARIETELPGQSDDQFIVAAFQLMLAVQPTSEEQAVCLDAIRETRAALKNRTKQQAQQRARENLVHALLNHNDFITIR